MGPRNQKHGNTKWYIICIPFPSVMTPHVAASDSQRYIDKQILISRMWNKSHPENI
jgi:hypothetical protein